MNRTEKERLIKEFETKFCGSKSCVFTEFRGLNVKRMEDLRRRSKEKNIEFHVIKNTLAERAYNSLNIDEKLELFIGPTAVAIGWDDPIIPIKVLSEFAKENPELIIKGGVVEGKIIAKNKISDLANLPPKEILLSQFLMGLNSPIRKLLNSLNSPLLGLINCLKAIEQKKS